MERCSIFVSGKSIIILIEREITRSNYFLLCLSCIAVSFSTLIRKAGHVVPLAGIPSGWKPGRLGAGLSLSRHSQIFFFFKVREEEKKEESCVPKVAL